MRNTTRLDGLLFLALAGLCLALLPRFVQGGDTGEMALAGANLLVPHPPGYPLHIWILKLFSWIPGPTLYWSLCLAGAVAALTTLFILHRESGGTWGTALTLLLATTPQFSRAALSTDVFALHALFTAAIVAASVRALMGRPRMGFATGFLFCLALAHHHTILFCTPLPLAVFLVRDQRRPLLTGAGVGLVAATLLYASLFLLQPDHPYSWGQLHTVHDLLKHIGRLDYGMLRLNPSTQTGGLASPLFFLVRQAPLLSATAIIAVFVWPHRKSLLKKPALAALTATLALYTLVFLPLANIEPQGAGADVLARFHVMPSVLLVFLCALLLQNQKPSRAVLACISAAILIQSYQAWREVRRLDSLIEDYAVNAIINAEGPLPTLVLAEGDSRFFPLRYALEKIHPAPRVTALSPSLLLKGWYRQKLSTATAGLVSLPPKDVDHIDLSSDLIAPLMGRASVLDFRDFNDSEHFQITYKGLGRLISLGRGVGFDLSALPRQRREAHTEELLSRAAGYELALDLASEYAYPFLMQGIMAFQSGKHEAAVVHFTNAVATAPWCVAALRNKCQALARTAPEEAAACEATLKSRSAALWPYCESNHR